MKDLIKYGSASINENTNTGMLTPRLEYSQEAADGHVYGIIKENAKFYIKCAPKKNTEILAEDFDYIGGYMNKKENEFSSYLAASKKFDLKMKSINEAYSASQYDYTPSKEEEPSDWQINETKEMRSEINRFNQIMGNVSKILREDKDYTVANNNNVPEAPASHPSNKKVNSPFTDTAVAKGDKEFTKTETNYEKAGAPFNQDGKVTDKDMQSDKKPSGSGEDKTYSEKAQYAPDNSVADKKPSGGKVVKVNENKSNRTIKLTEEQVLAWNKSKDYMDKSHGTEIGSSAPFTDELGQESNLTEANTEAIHEGEAAHNTDNQNSPAPHTGEVGDTAPFDQKVNEDIVDVNDVAGMEMDNDVPFPEVANDDMGVDEFEYEFDEDPSMAGGIPFDGEETSLDINSTGMGDETNFMESKQHTNEQELHDFGKHPAYQKEPFQLPPNKEVAPNGAKDWNDKSVESDKPFGSQIGSSAPFDEKVIDMLADSIMQKMGFTKKA